MHLKYVILENIRNHKKTELHFEPGLNIFFGANGSGKTSILEAISIASFSKSFITNFDQQIVSHSRKYYSVEIGAVTENQIPFTINVIYQINKGKEIRDSSGQILSSVELIGKIPLVVLYPEMKKIIFGPPSSRREFVDKIISQIDRIYLQKLIEYRRILKQRNKLLFEIYSGDHSQIGVLSVWNNRLIEAASYILKQRWIFTKSFSTLFQKSFEMVTNGKEISSFDFSPFGFDSVSHSVFLQNPERSQIISSLEQILEEYHRREIERGTTLFGPHKDDFEITLNDMPAKEIASQGQSKSLVIALKYAEIKYLQNLLGTTPIVLFDDIFSELDFNRVTQVLDMMNNLKVQLFLTLTELDKIKNIISNFETYGIFKVENGSVEKVNNI
ncbi:MAG: DNA replication/repair protein RecF [Candidatus Kapaibacteriota bacterium]